MGLASHPHVWITYEVFSVLTGGGHDLTGHDLTGHDLTGRDPTGHDLTGHDLMDQYLTKR